MTNFAGAHDHGGGRPVPEHAQVPEELGQLVRRGGQINLVARPQDEIAGGDDGLPLPGHGADQDPDPDIPVEVGQLHPVQGGALRQAVLHQLQAALGEGLQLHGRREPQDAGNLSGCRLLRIDGHGEAQLVAHEPQLLFVLWIADAGDGVLHAQLFRHQARQNIDFVTGCGGDQKLGLVHLRLLLHIVAGTISADGHHIINVDDIFNQLGIFVDHRDLVARGELLCQCCTDLARAYDDDFHVASLVFS